MSYQERTLEFLSELVRVANWDLRFSPQGFPYAAIPQGFGNREKGVKLHFIPNGGSVKVVGVIAYSNKIGIYRPAKYVSLNSDVHQATQLLKERLLPDYKEAWYNAQPLIAKWLEENPQS